MPHYLDDDIVDVRVDGHAETYQLYWGDEIELGEKSARGQHIGFRRYGEPATGVISAKAKGRTEPILKFSLVDVQQGDGMVLETPGGQRVLIDGGDNVLFARHVAKRFGSSSPENPLVLDAVIVTHGDADHFEGLNLIRASEKHSEPGKRLYATTRRILHNGLVKRPGSTPTAERLGPLVSEGGKQWCVDLHEDLLQVQPASMNEPFRDWQETLQVWNARLQQVENQPIAFSRVDHTTDGAKAFDFLRAEGLTVDVLGPVVGTVGGRPALQALRTPPKDANIASGQSGQTGGMSPSHTINGHSITIRLGYGNVRFLLTGDLNQESMALIRGATTPDMFQAEIFKTPHHGSHDFDFAFVKQVSPVVSVISSGDESAAKEHIHPRATLLAALGRASRTDTGVIFCTELAAFFKTKGYMPDPTSAKPNATFYAFERSNFGIINIRTDGSRVLAFTHSGEKGSNEAYRFDVDENHDVTFAADVSKRSAPAA